MSNSSTNPARPIVRQKNSLALLLICAGANLSSTTSPASAKPFPESTSKESRSTLAASGMPRIDLTMRIHRIKSDDTQAVNCTLSSTEVSNLVDSANEYWAQAGIHWNIEQILDADSSGEFDLLSMMSTDADDQKKQSDYSLPSIQWLAGSLDVVLVNDLGMLAGGVTLPGGKILFAQYGRLVEGTHAALPPVVLAHELGHALGLKHVSCDQKDNFMLGRCESRDGSESKLTQAQIAKARRKAAQVHKRYAALTDAEKRQP